MANLSDSYRQFWETLSLFEDHLKSGFRADRSVPDFSAAGNGPAAGDVMVSDGGLSGPGNMGAADAGLADLDNRIKACTLCGLSANRLQAVPGEGKQRPAVLVVGEAPGADEDKTGRPFVGKAGQYLDKWLSAIGLSRDTNCFIANIIKCRPPQNRDPAPDEISACMPYLKKQIELLKPMVILSLGRFSSQVLAGEKRGINELRGGSYMFGNIHVVPTFHPSAVLRDPSLRAAVWEDLKRLKDLLNHVKVL
ncbi:MAG: uracil-DNA glycosylase [Spirochaetaceae bacterium]|nr:MAG: uracil-DNA glycosylase [Spirochaetaceae bacterium]